MQKETKTEITKQKIMTESMKEFGNNGYYGASINSICKSGIAKGLLYHNFASKEELYLACVKQTFDTLTEHMKRANIGASFHEYTKIRLAFFMEHENEAKLFFEAILQPPKTLKEKIKEIRFEFDNYNEKLYKQILNNIEIRSCVSQEEAVNYFKLLQEMFNGYFISKSVDHLSLKDTIFYHEEGINKMFDFMLYGIAKRGDKD